MKKRTKTPLELGKREQQVFETISRLQQATVRETLAELAEPPSYSAVRATMNLLVDKGWLRVAQRAGTGVYRPAAGMEKTRRDAAKKFLSTFFSESTSAAVAALLDVSSSKLTIDELDELNAMIAQARTEAKQ